MKTIDRMYWMASCIEGFNLFTHHKIGIFLLNALLLLVSANSASVRLFRWAVYLCSYNYICAHINGEEKVRADLLFRWSPSPIVRCVTKIPPLPSADALDFKWRSRESITDEQRRGNRPSNLKMRNGLYKTPNGHIWVQNDADLLQLRLFIIAHTSSAGHQGREATEAASQESFYWSTIAKDVELLTHACIHCLSTIGEERVSRLFWAAAHRTKPNHLLQFDYHELVESNTGEN